MPKLIVVSGSVNAGKTSVSQALAGLIPRAAHVQGDALRYFVTRLPLEEALPVTFANIVAVSSNFLSAGFDVVLDYPLYKPDCESLCASLSGTAIYPLYSRYHLVTDKITSR